MSKADVKRYLDALHGVQSGIAQEMHIDPGPTTPKQLRVGVSSTLVGQAALAALLIEKGTFTLDEYEASLAKEAVAERTRYEQRLTKHYGGQTKITLG